MAFSEIPEELKAFICSRFTAVEQLEVMLLLKSQRCRDWSATAVGSALAIQPASAATRLASLQAGGLLTVSENRSPEKRYRFSPTDANLARLADELEELYRERKHTVITLIASNPGDAVQVFSNRLQLRRHGGEGV